MPSIEASINALCSYIANKNPKLFRSIEFSCKIGQLDATGIDMITLNEQGLIENFEVVMRPHKSVGELRKSMTLM